MDTLKTWVEEAAYRKTPVQEEHSIRIALLEQAMQNLAKELRGINGNISKLIWIAVTAVGLAVGRFIISGGLNV
jgi:hypothetical protein